MKSFAALLILITLGASVLSACTASPEAAIPEVSATRTVDEMKAVILEANQALNDRPVRYLSTTLVDGGQSVSTTFESVPPDRVHILSETSEYIVIGEEVYLRSGDGWQQMPIDAGNFRNPDSQTQLAGSIANIEYRGQESLNNVLMDVYQYTSTVFQNDMPMDNAYTIWVNPDDGLMYQMVNEGQAVQMDSATGELSTANAISTIVFTYDPDLTIELP
jgi:hypothetical protein